MRLFLVFILAFTAIQGAQAQDKDITLSTVPILVENGFLQYVLPRFSLKTGVSIEVKTSTQLAVGDVILATRPPTGSAAKIPPLMQGLSQTFYAWPESADAAARRFIGWLTSDIGQRTIQAFQIEGEQVFFAVERQARAIERQPVGGDIVQGETLAFRNCGRCHVISERNRMQGLGSTPSFGLLRTFEDWLGRFEGFFALNPHPSFSQVEGITLPFDPLLPPPISPLVLTQDELQSIIAFVATIPLADLGAPLVHQ